MKKLGFYVFSAVATFLSMIGVSFAAVDATVTTALSDGLTDVKTIGAAALIIVIAIAVFRKMRGAA